MKVILAFIATVISTRILLLVGAAFGWIFKPVFSVLGEQTCGRVCQFLGGVIGSASSMAAALFLFEWIAKPVPSVLLPILAGVISIAIPVMGEISRLRGLSALRKESPLVDQLTIAIGNMRASIVGEVLGIVSGAILIFWME